MLEKEDESKEKAADKAKWLVEWWDKNGQGYRKYGDRKKFLSSEIRNTKEAVAKKIQDKLNKGYYKIVNQTVKMKDGTVKAIQLSAPISTEPFNITEGTERELPYRDLDGSQSVSKDLAAAFSRFRR